MTTNGTKLLVGTGKGAFILNRTGNGWSIDGPHFAGRSVYAMELDRRSGSDRIWAAAQSMHRDNIGSLRAVAFHLRCNCAIKR